MTEKSQDKIDQLKTLISLIEKGETFLEETSVFEVANPFRRDITQISITYGVVGVVEGIRSVENLKIETDKTLFPEQVLQSYAVSIILSERMRVRKTLESIYSKIQIKTQENTNG